MLKIQCGLLAAVLLLAPALPALADDAPTPARIRKPAGAGAETIRSAVEVMALDTRARTLTLKRDDGNTFSVVADPAVRNLAQIKPGDFMIAVYGRARALTIAKLTANGEESTPEAAAAKKQTGMQRKKRTTADIVAIDDKKGFATLKEGRDHVIDVLVADRKALAAVKIGDRVTLDYLDAVAVSLKPARTRR